jgi:prefoldin subunit 5
MEKINNTQAKKLVTTEVMIDANEIKRQIDVWQEKINSIQATIDQYNGEIASYQKEIDNCIAQLSELKSIGVEPVKECSVEPLQEEVVK